MSKRPGSFTFTYSRKNSDVMELIERKKDADKTFITTDYFCEAARFYEKYKDTNELKKLIMDVIQKEIPIQISSISSSKLDSASNEIKAEFDGKFDGINESDLEED